MKERGENQLVFTPLLRAVPYLFVEPVTLAPNGVDKIHRWVNLFYLIPYPVYVNRYGGRFAYGIVIPDLAEQIFLAEYRIRA